MKKKQQINKQHEWILEKKSEIRTSNLLHSTQTLYHMRYFWRYHLPFKCNRWTCKCVLIWDESLNLNPALNPQVTWHLSFFVQNLAI